MKKIPITEELRNYVEKVTYEINRYDDLLNSVTKNNMTEEEWNSSFEYFNNLYEIANLEKQFILDEIYNAYKEIILNQEWYIDFIDCCVIILEAEESRVEKPSDEEYQNYIARLFINPEDSESLAINSNHVKDITFQVTENCNMACTYCYQHSKTTNRMSFETAKTFIDMILDADELSNTYITSTRSLGAVINFIGGEPLLEIELISKISQYFINELFRRKHPWAIRFMFSITSNGLLHFDSKVQEYFYQHNKHLSYGVSLDGDKALHDTCRLDHAGNGTYDRVSAAIKDYQAKFNSTPGSKITISPDSVDKVANALKSFIIDHGYIYININCTYEAEWTNEQANILYWQLHEVVDWLFENDLQNEIHISMFKSSNGEPLDENNNQNWCGGTGLMIAVNHAGNIYPCLRYTEISSNPNNPSFTIGDIKNGINILPEHKERLNCLSCITRRSQSTDECFNCPIASGCGWCSAYHYEIYGTPNKRATNICCMHKAETLANYYYQRKMKNEYSMNCPKEWAVEIIGEEEYNKLIQM